MKEFFDASDIYQDTMSFYVTVYLPPLMEMNKKEVKNIAQVASAMINEKDRAKIAKLSANIPLFRKGESFSNIETAAIIATCTIALLQDTEKVKLVYPLIDLWRKSKASCTA
ncbi:MAG: hypothetical protein QXQ02_04160 [Halobacteria archaeon]